VRHTRRRGFSLIELVVCITIISIVAGLAAVRFGRSAERARVESAAKRVAAAVDDARTRARTRGSSCRLAVDPAAGTLQMKGVMSGRAELDLICLSKSPYKVSIKLADFGGKTDLDFTSRGRPLAGGKIGVASGAFVRTVTVDPETGHASID